MRGFDFPSFLTGLLVGMFIAVSVMMPAQEAQADTTAEAALFRACAVQEREHGDREAEELFRAAARNLGGTNLLPSTVKVRRSTCLGLRATAELYRPVSEGEER